MDDYYHHSNANIHRGIHVLAETATELYESAREKVAAFINAASSKEIIYTRNTTESINLVAFSWGRAESQIRRRGHPDRDGASLQPGALADAG